jgi:hypothetical protein
MTETHKIIIHMYVTGYQVNSGEFLRSKRFYIASSPQDADNKGSVSSCCIKTVFIAHCSEVRDNYLTFSYILKLHGLSEMK